MNKNISVTCQVTETARISHALIHTFTSISIELLTIFFTYRVYNFFTYRKYAFVKLRKFSNNIRKLHNFWNIKLDFINIDKCWKDKLEIVNFQMIIWSFCNGKVLFELKRL